MQTREYYEAAVSAELDAALGAEDFLIGTFGEPPTTDVMNVAAEYRIQRERHLRAAQVYATLAVAAATGRHSGLVG